MASASFVLAGTHSGCGKTTVTLGIMAALCNRGYKVQPFKVGPDFIDPGHHKAITGRNSYNLDGWMLSKKYVQQIFKEKFSDADFAVVEGVMGLFDGFSGSDESGSTAQIAKWLDLPVLLVVDAKSMARSAAALVYGYANFDHNLDLAGVVFNQVGSKRHAKILSVALQGLDIPSLSFLPKKTDLEIPSRHLGLITSEDLKPDTSRIGRLSSWIEENLNLDKLLTICSPQKEHPKYASKSEAKDQSWEIKSDLPYSVNIAVARDKAFCFYYLDNLMLLKKAGAKLHFFSPLRDSFLPKDISGIYFGGGYPELYSRKLALNQTLKTEIKRFADMGGCIYAECGGFMFLMQNLIDTQGNPFPMTDIFPFSAHMQERFQALGYREIKTICTSLLGPTGTLARGHEFHYSQIENCTEDKGVELLYQISEQKDNPNSYEGYKLNNVIGSYIHLHWGSNPKIARNFVQFCKINR